MAHKRLMVLWSYEFDYMDSWRYEYKIVSGNETIFYGARTYTTKSNLFRGIRRAMEKMGTGEVGGPEPGYYTWPEFIIEEDK